MRFRANAQTRWRRSALQSWAVDATAVGLVRVQGVKRRSFFLLLPCVAAAGLLILGVATIRRERPVPSAKPEAESDTPSAYQPSDTDRRVAALQSEIERLRWRVDGLSSRPPGQQSAATLANANPSPEPAKRREEELRRLEERVRTGPRDPEWSSRTESLIGRLFSSTPHPGTSFRSVTCGATACVVELDHETRDAQSELAPVILAKEPFQSAGANRFRYQKQGALATTVFVIRSDSQSK
jgi:hypothetical protein